MLRLCWQQEGKTGRRFCYILVVTYVTQCGRVGTVEAQVHVRCCKFVPNWNFGNVTSVLFTSMTVLLSLMEINKVFLKLLTDSLIPFFLMLNEGPHHCARFSAKNNVKFFKTLRDHTNDKLFSWIYNWFYQSESEYCVSCLLIVYDYDYWQAKLGMTANEPQERSRWLPVTLISCHSMFINFLEGTQGMHTKSW